MCDVRTVSGAVDLRQIKGPIKAESVSGLIAFQDTSGVITAGTISGPIRGRLVALLGDSAFSSVSGPVDIESSSPLDSLRFDLASLSGRIVVGHIAAPRGLRMGLTGPLVKGRSVSGPISFRESEGLSGD